MKQSTATATLPAAELPTAAAISSFDNGYTPSEGSSTLATQVARQAKERLGSTSYHFLRFVDCRFQNGVLTLRGRVPSFYLKQVAQSVLTNIEGVDRIDNRVDVVSPRGLSSVRRATRVA